MTEPWKKRIVMLTGWLRNFFFVTISIVGILLSVEVQRGHERPADFLCDLLIAQAIGLFIFAAAHGWFSFRMTSGVKKLKGRGKYCPPVNMIVKRISEHIHDAVGKTKHDVIIFYTTKPKAEKLTVLAASGNCAGMESLHISDRNENECHGYAGRCWHKNSRAGCQPEVVFSKTHELRLSSEADKQDYARRTGMKMREVKKNPPPALHHWAFPIRIDDHDEPWGIILIRSNARIYDNERELIGKYITENLWDAVDWLKKFAIRQRELQFKYCQI
ncbi:MAG: hypothetical protein FWE88_00555 [Phycisphaerae bacterium]|nr:hypothetical protein [Phycisphaerae bacterium]